MIDKKDEEIIRAKVQLHEQSPLLWNEKFVWSQIKKGIVQKNRSYAWIYAAASVLLAFALGVFSYTTYQNERLAAERALTELKIKELETKKLRLMENLAQLEKNKTTEDQRKESATSPDKSVVNQNMKIRKPELLKKFSDNPSPQQTLPEEKIEPEIIAPLQNIESPIAVAENVSTEKRKVTTNIVGIIPDQEEATRESNIRLRYSSTEVMLPHDKKSIFAKLQN